MSYKLRFKTKAKEEWDRLDTGIRQQFKKKLLERLQSPRVPKSKLYSMKDCYKIKLRGSGFRLVYQVHDNVLTVVVVAVGKRERKKVYKSAEKRL